LFGISYGNPYFALTELWRPDGTYTNHRIPGMLVTSKGTLLVYCEARRSSSDWALMDILLQRSEDHGKTFGSPYKLAIGTEMHKTVNNPVMLQDNNGRIHFLYCEDYTVNGGRALRRYSDDDGLSWSEPIDVTAFTMPHYHNAFAFGPGHGIMTKDGTLIVPIWMVPKYHNAPINAHSPSVISTFFSTDNGESWSIGEILDSTSDITNPNETAAALTSDGVVYLNIRFQGNCRAKAYSKNGYSHWTQYAPDRNLPDPQCFGSLAVLNGEGHPHTIIFANCASESSRTCVTVRASCDDGRTYPVSRLLDKERGGYVEVAVDNGAQLIYVLYEDKFGISDHLAVFNYEWLINE
jgi:sialidase-1